MRFATYAYDAQDRAILSTHAGGVHQVRLRYEPGRTLVTNSLGRVSVYRLARLQGLAVVTQIAGAGCGACGTEGEVRYRYNARGGN